jgi:hypothetical protein
LNPTAAAPLLDAAGAALAGELEFPAEAVEAGAVAVPVAILVLVPLPAPEVTDAAMLDATEDMFDATEDTDDAADVTADELGTNTNEYLKATTWATHTWAAH